MCASMPEASIRALLVDDEPLAIERLQILAARLPALQVVGSAHDAASALRMIAALEPELLLLDIAMPGLTGIELARQLLAMPNPPLVIFVTAFDSYAVAAFDVAAVDYLLKPIDPERLERAIGRALNARAAAPQSAAEWAQEFWVPNRGEISRIAAADIDRIEAERDYMRLHVGARSYLLHATIVELERRLDPALFIRLHRSTIVRRDRISALRREPAGSWVALLADGNAVPIGRTYLDAARALRG